MRTILFIMLAAGLLAACGTGQQKRNAPGADSARAVIPDLVNAPVFYVQLKGTLGSNAVTMQLVKTEPGVFRGYYSYDNTGEPIGIWGNPDSSHGSNIVLYEDVQGSEEQFFSGTLESNGLFKGTWRGKGTSYPFNLKANMTDATALEVHFGTDSARLLPNYAQSPRAVAVNSLLWPAPGVPAETAAFIKQSIVKGPPAADAGVYVKKDIDSFLAGYKASAMDYDTTDPEIAASATWNWEASRYMQVVYNRYPLLVLETYNYEFTGGAHGNHGSTFRVLDLEKKQVLTPADVFKEGYRTALVPELEKAFRKKYGIPDDESLDGSLLVKEIEPGDNFFITDKGVAFSYTPYEIGPYALGQVTLFIPFEQIGQLLKKAP